MNSMKATVSSDIKDWNFCFSANLSFENLYSNVENIVLKSETCPW